MLELRNISKEYRTGAEVVHALRGVDLAFRESEFVSILGPSGCGKTTMLNIMGGLDQYTDGDLVIDGISTREYKDADWDAYRNDTIGFVFQSYNLISHQTVLANVELALTLSGVSPAERRRKAIVALEQVGLGDQINKKPAQMSGGQVQRVAIARALINDPDIILADEPTGALDSETSTQVMSILKDISTRKLVIMVTHNPDLAEEYSTRIVRLSDGRVISDSNPFVPGAPGQAATAVPAAAAAVAAAAPADTGGAALSSALSGDAPGSAPAATRKPKSGRARRRRNKSMSMMTALHLSLNNLMTKKARTFLTAFAGSIGIIGIALILSVSNGFQKYIDKLEEDTLSSYPLRIQSETADMTSMITAFAEAESSSEEVSGDDKIQEQQVMAEMLGSIGSNDLTAFKEYLDSNMETLSPWFNDYEYAYGIAPTIYSTDMKYGVLRVSPGSIMQSYMNGLQTSMVAYANTDVFFRMMNNQELLQSQYQVLAGKWPEKYDELLLVLDSEDQLNDYIVYTLGLRDPQELKDMINEVVKGNEVDVDHEPLEWTYDDFIGKEFALVNPCDTFRRNSSYNVWEDMTNDEDFMKDLIEKSEKIHISGIVCPKDKSGANAMTIGIGYLPSLTEHMIEYASESDIVKIQRESKNTDVFSGKSFEDIRNNTDQGLGFEDMISIDRDKLAKALGGNIDPKAVEKEISKVAKDEIESIAAEDSAEKIEDDVTEALRAACNGMVDYIVEQAESDPAHFKLDDAMIAKAFAANLDTGKHAKIVNGMLSGYAELLKSLASQINDAMGAGIKPNVPDSGQTPGTSDGGQNPGQNDGGQQQGGDGSSQGSDPQTGDEGSSGDDGSTPDSGDSGSSDGNQPSSGTSSGGQTPGTPSAGGFAGLPGGGSFDPSAMIGKLLRSALEPTVDPYVDSKELQEVVKKYGEGIEMLNIANNVGPSIQKVAGIIGGQFKVDPAGIADAFTMKMNEEELTRLITAYISGDDETSYESNLRKLGYADLRNPVSMAFYLKDFDSKEAFLDFIDSYNADMKESGKDDLVISYTDITGVMMKSVKTITNAVSYVLIAFVAISLIVSSIMIGVITYISVLERTKEIGILRAIGASKRDISRIFNAETIIVGLCAGAIGIAVSLLLLIPINKILLSLTGIKSLRAVLPPAGGVALILISIFLTFIAGLIPSGMAARKDPVVALRTE